MLYWHQERNTIPVPGKRRSLVNSSHLYQRNSAQEEAPLVSQMGVASSCYNHSSAASLQTSGRQELEVPTLPHPTHLPPWLSLILALLSTQAIDSSHWDWALSHHLSLLSRINFCFPSLTPSSLLIHRREDLSHTYIQTTTPKDTTKPIVHTLQRLQASFTLGCLGHLIGFCTWDSIPAP